MILRCNSYVYPVRCYAFSDEQPLDKMPQVWYIIVMDNKQIARIKNSAQARRINRLFGVWNRGDFQVKRLLDDVKIPKFYTGFAEIPMRTPGVFFLWRYYKGAVLEYIGSAHRCVRTGLRTRGLTGYIVSVATIHNRHVSRDLARFLVSLLEPKKQSRLPDHIDPVGAQEDVREYWAAVAKKFWAKVEMPDGLTAPEDCNFLGPHAIWTGGKSGRYGMFRLGGRPMTAHRAAYILERGEIPPGAQIRHSCPYHLCCNPSHLRLVGGTDAEIPDYESLDALLIQRYGELPQETKSEPVYYNVQDDGSLMEVG